jgi:hypothetical protein
VKERGLFFLDGMRYVALSKDIFDNEPITTGELDAILEAET